MSVTAIVPMRHSSERVPGKNRRLFAGRPLYCAILDALRAAERVSAIVVDTDSPDIMAGVAERYPGVKVVERPEELRGGEVPMNSVLLHTTDVIDAPLYLQTHSTNPLLRPQTIDRAIAAFSRNDEKHDSLFSVTRLQTRLWSPKGEPLNHDPTELLRTQDLPPVYEENSNIYLFTRELLARRGTRIGEDPMLFEIDAVEAVDIDVELDFRVAEFLWGDRQDEMERHT